MPKDVDTPTQKDLGTNVRAGAGRLSRNEITENARVLTYIARSRECRSTWYAADRSRRPLHFG